MTSPVDPVSPGEGAVALASGAAHGRADWEKAAAGVLRKSGRMTADDSDELVWEKLTRRTLDGLAISPLGTAALVEGLQTSGRPDRAGAWDVRAWFGDPDPRATAADIATDLENGVTSVWLEVGAGGVAVSDLGAALSGVLLDAAPVVLQADDPVAAAEAFAALATGSPTELADGTNLGADPLAALARDRADVDVEAVVGAVASTATSLGCRALVVDGTAVHDLGASDVQELGWTLAAGAAYLRLLVASGRSVEDAANLVEFRLRRHRRAVPDHRQAPRGAPAVGAGARAQRCRRRRPPPAPARGHVAPDDDQVRPLGEHAAHLRRGVRRRRRRRRRRHGAARSTPGSACPDAFGRRIARNTSALLVDESHVAKVSRPGRWCVRRRAAHRRRRRSPAGPSSSGSRPTAAPEPASPTAPRTGSPTSWPSATARSPAASGR